MYQTLLETLPLPIGFNTFASLVPTALHCIGHGVTSHFTFGREHLLKPGATFDSIIASVNFVRRVRIGFATLTFASLMSICCSLLGLFRCIVEPFLVFNKLLLLPSPVLL